jgi:peptidoglycan hydrolase-like protein with peptidoglycan-binding domain
VLGAALYFFATDLTVGSTGADVMELQKVLIEAGYLKIAAPTGYFGPMTQAAVKLYQAAKGIQTTGYVGPLTRAALNQGTAPKTAEEQIADLMAQLKALQAQQ